MFIKLNAVEEDLATENRKLTLSRLNDTLLNPENNLAKNKPAQYFHRLADCELELGLYEYQFDQSAKTKILHYMNSAAEHEVHSYDLSESKNQGPLRRQNLFSVVVSFGTEQQRAHVAAYSAEAHGEHFAGLEKSSLEISNKQVDYLNQVQRYLAGASIEADVVKEIIKDLQSKKSDTYIQNLQVPEAKLLIALADKNEDAWNAALAMQVDGHKKTAISGSYKRLNQGLMDLSGLMYAKLGMEIGMTCTVSSPYLPLHLII